MLDEAGDVFFLTAEEVAVAASAPVPSLRRRATVRSRQYRDDRARFASLPSESYPPFLIGDRPLRSDADDECRANRPTRYARGAGGFETGGTDGTLWGEPVSPGIGRGRARVVARPEDLAAIRPGEVLVTRGVDPGWTAVFDRLAGLIAERGGQLSHASVVAREYRLPSVVAVAGATAIIHTGDQVVVDGGTGQVCVLARGV
jgi:pyruvate,water dikinase